MAAVAPASTGVLAEVSKHVSRRFGRGRSGFHLIPKNDDALRWRLALIDEAKVSVDIQYYIWNRDDAGWLLMDRCVAAAERGVRVRLLVDAFYVLGNDDNIAAESRHPNFEIRVWNPRPTGFFPSMASSSSFTSPSSASSSVSSRPSTASSDPGTFGS